MRFIDLDEEKKFENSKILNDEVRAHKESIIGLLSYLFSNIEIKAMGQ